MKKIFFQLLLVGSLLASLSGVQPASAQDSRFERRFPNPKAEVDKALQEIQGSTKGRLPILEGFVDETKEPLDHFQRGFYECDVQVSSEADGTTLVRVAAKITAWHAGSGATPSGYRVLPSNGRIEADVLDQLRELLGKKQTGTAPAAVAPAPRPALELPSAPTPASTGLARPLAQPAIGPAIAPSAKPGAEPSNQDLASLRQRREEAEKKAKSLNEAAQNFEEILRNQSHPDNLAVVRKAGTPVLAKPGGTVLLSAEAEDEFEILGVEGSWVHVQISGESRGWIQRSQLDLPEGFAGISKSATASAGENQSPFHITRQETHPFSGAWPQLQGKIVRIIWVEPTTSSSSSTSTAEAKRKFAKSAFLNAYKEQASASPPPDGVVIVFDAMDGGQISATMSSLSQWQAGQLSEESFWTQCSIDPPDLLLDVHGP